MAFLDQGPCGFYFLVLPYFPHGFICYKNLPEVYVVLSPRYPDLGLKKVISFYGTFFRLNHGIYMKYNPKIPMIMHRSLKVDGLLMSSKLESIDLGGGSCLLGSIFPKTSEPIRRTGSY